VHHHAKDACDPLVSAVVVRLQRELLRDHVLAVIVIYKRLVVDGEVLVDGLMRLDVLERGLTVEAEPAVGIARVQTGGGDESAERL
jgi:hypothetical protein